MDQGVKLHREFVARERAAMRGGSVREVKKGLLGALGGILTMLLAIGITVVVTRISFYWHSFLLEFLFAAFAGYLITKTGGGLLRGVIFLPAAYGAAFLMRRYGWDPSTALADSVVIAGHGQLLAVCCLVGCGGVFGYTQEVRG